MILTILDDLKTIIEGITGVQVVYIHEPQEIAQYPAVILRALGHEDSYKTLRDTERIYRVGIEVFGELTGNFQTVQGKVIELSETINDTITNTANISLSGTVQFTKLTKGEARFITGDSKLYVYNTVYEASTLINRGS